MPVKETCKDDGLRCIIDSMKNIFLKLFLVRLNKIGTKWTGHISLRRKKGDAKNFRSEILNGRTIWMVLPI
jgi:hypothetical protein